MRSKNAPAKLFARSVVPIDALNSGKQKTGPHKIVDVKLQKKLKLQKYRDKLSGGEGATSANVKPPPPTSKSVQTCEEEEEDALIAFLRKYNKKVEEQKYVSLATSVGNSSTKSAVATSEMSPSAHGNGEIQDSLPHHTDGPRGTKPRQQRLSKIRAIKLLDCVGGGGGEEGGASVADVQFSIKERNDNEIVASNCCEVGVGNVVERTTKSSSAKLPRSSVKCTKNRDVDSTATVVTPGGMVTPVAPPNAIAGGINATSTESDLTDALRAKLLTFFVQKIEAQEDAESLSSTVDSGSNISVLIKDNQIQKEKVIAKRQQLIINRLKRKLECNMNGGGSAGEAGRSGSTTNCEESTTTSGANSDTEDAMKACRSSNGRSNRRIGDVGDTSVHGVSDTTTTGEVDVVIDEKVKRKIAKQLHIDVTDKYNFSKESAVRTKLRPKASSPHNENERRNLHQRLKVNRSNFHKLKRLNDGVGAGRLRMINGQSHLDGSHFLGFDKSVKRFKEEDARRLDPDGLFNRSYLNLDDERVGSVKVVRLNDDLATPSAVSNTSTTTSQKRKSELPQMPSSTTKVVLFRTEPEFLLYTLVAKKSMATRILKLHQRSELWMQMCTNKLMKTFKEEEEEETNEVRFGFVENSSTMPSAMKILSSNNHSCDVLGDFLNCDRNKLLLEVPVTSTIAASPLTLRDGKDEKRKGDGGNEDREDTRLSFLDVRPDEIENWKAFNAQLEISPLPIAPLSFSPAQPQLSAVMGPTVVVTEGSSKTESTFCSPCHVVLDAYKMKEESSVLATLPSNKVDKIVNLAKDVDLENTDVTREQKFHLLHTEQFVPNKIDSANQMNANLRTHNLGLKIDRADQEESVLVHLETQKLIPKVDGFNDTCVDSSHIETLTALENETSDCRMTDSHYVKESSSQNQIESNGSRELIHSQTLESAEANESLTKVDDLSFTSERTESTRSIVPYSDLMIVSNWKSNDEVNKLTTDFTLSSSSDALSSSLLSTEQRFKHELSLKTMKINKRRRERVIQMRKAEVARLKIANHPWTIHSAAGKKVNFNNKHQRRESTVTATTSVVTVKEEEHENGSDDVLVDEKTVSNSCTLPQTFPDDDEKEEEKVSWKIGSNVFVGGRENSKHKIGNMNDSSLSSGPSVELKIHAKKDNHERKQDQKQKVDSNFYRKRKLANKNSRISKQQSSERNGCQSSLFVVTDLMVDSKFGRPSSCDPKFGPSEDIVVKNKIDESVDQIVRNGPKKTDTAGKKRNFGSGTKKGRKKDKLGQERFNLQMSQSTKIENCSSGKESKIDTSKDIDSLNLIAEENVKTNGSIISAECSTSGGVDSRLLEPANQSGHEVYPSKNTDSMTSVVTPDTSKFRARGTGTSTLSSSMYDLVKTKQRKSLLHSCFSESSNFFRKDDAVFLFIEYYRHLSCKWTSTTASIETAKPFFKLPPSMMNDQQLLFLSKKSIFSIAKRINRLADCSSHRMFLNNNYRLFSTIVNKSRRRIDLTRSGGSFQREAGKEHREDKTVGTHLNDEAPFHDLTSFKLGGASLQLDDELKQRLLNISCCSVDAKRNAVVVPHDGRIRRCQTHHRGVGRFCSNVTKEKGLFCNNNSKYDALKSDAHCQRGDGGEQGPLLLAEENGEEENDYAALQTMFKEKKRNRTRKCKRLSYETVKTVLFLIFLFKKNKEMFP